MNLLQYDTRPVSDFLHIRKSLQKLTFVENLKKQLSTYKLNCRWRHSYGMFVGGKSSGTGWDANHIVLKQLALF